MSSIWFLRTESFGVCACKWVVKIRIGTGRSGIARVAPSTDLLTRQSASAQSSKRRPYCATIG